MFPTFFLGYLHDHTRAIQLEIFSKIFCTKSGFYSSRNNVALGYACIESSFMISYLLTVGWGRWNAPQFSEGAKVHLHGRYYDVLFIYYLSGIPECKVKKNLCYAFLVKLKMK